MPLRRFLSYVVTPRRIVGSNQVPNDYYESRQPSWVAIITYVLCRMATSRARTVFCILLGEITRIGSRISDSFVSQIQSIALRMPRVHVGLLNPSVINDMTSEIRVYRCDSELHV